MGVAIDVSSNFKKLNKSLDRLGKRQLPFAFSRTINDVMFEARKEIVERVYPRSFDVRDRRFFGSAMLIRKSKVPNLSVTLFDKLGRTEFLERQARGGIKGRGSGRVAIPSRELAARRTGKGVPKTLRPRAAIDNRRAFIGKTSRNQDVIYQRRGRRRYPIKVLYVLKDSAQIPKRFPFYETGQRIMRKRMRPIFKKRFAEAVRTAKRV